ncbi:MAG TPA: efflux RND transporter periplasmic adaptor subunit [Gemmatimonadales bacterium]|nr:efflux RND transporter periplasmic adaptor subunit [Gemmatimonadales bacterium]
MIRWSRAFAAGCTLALLGAACGGEKKSAPTAVDVVVAPVQVRDVPIVREWAAQTFGANDVEIRARVKGYLLQKAYQEGTMVKKGALLFQIDPQEYQAAAAQARATLVQAQAGLSKANTDVNRLRPLAERHAVSQQDLDHAVAAQDAAKGQVDAARAVLQNAELNLGYTRVTTPITGLAGVAQADVGSLVGSPGPTLLTVVSQMDTIKVKFRISEQEYLTLMRALGDTAGQTEHRPPGNAQLDLVLADGSVYGSKGHVVTVDRNVDPTTGTLGIEALFPNPTGLLRPGQFGRIRAPVTTRSNAIVLPQRAVRELQGTYSIGVLKPDSTVEIRPIKAGARVGSDWVVDSGLTANDIVVVDGMQKVRPGVKVHATRAPADSAQSPPAASQASDTTQRR